jgi:hypothetical protein
MQFRIQSLLVLVATCALTLAVSSGAPLPYRIALLVSVFGIWLGIGVTRGAMAIRVPWLATSILLVGLLLTSLAISATALMGGEVLHHRWQQIVGG